MRKTLIALTLAALPISAIAMSSQPSQAELTEKQAEARQVAKQFLGNLKPELVKAMKSGGPVHAVGTCFEISPEISKKLSKETGWNVNRVSLKPRATTANPDQWETETLNWFDAQLAEGNNPKKLEKFEIVKVDGEDTYRYMKAIPTGEVCLTCHGESVPKAVKDKIVELYPQDKATGYQKGQIRGAFSFQQAVK